DHYSSHVLSARTALSGRKGLPSLGLPLALQLGAAGLQGFERILQLLLQVVDLLDGLRLEVLLERLLLLLHPGDLLLELLLELAERAEVNRPRRVEADAARIDRRPALRDRPAQRRHAARPAVREEHAASAHAADAAGQAAPCVAAHDGARDATGVRAALAA